MAGAAIGRYNDHHIPKYTKEGLSNALNIIRVDNLGIRKAGRR